MPAAKRRRFSVYVGWDPREIEAYDVCAFSLYRRSSHPFSLRAIKLGALQAAGWYRRETSQRDGRLWDTVSDAPMSTEFAISRFFVPLLARHHGDTADWAVFCDCDFLWLDDIAKLIETADDSKALMCVQHHHEPPEGLKMDGQMQLRYSRKNWSSLMLFNLRHPAHAALDLATLNTTPGRDLHRFHWLSDDQIGALESGWNWLEGWSPKGDTPPQVVHYTRGGPWMPEWTNVAYADLWLAEHDAMTLAQRQPSQGAKAAL